MSDYRLERLGPNWWPEPSEAEKPGTVYLMESGGLYKIGITRRPVERRARDIEHASGRPVRVVASALVRYPRFEEQSLHAIFAEFRTIGEWFRFPLTPYDIEEEQTETGVVARAIWHADWIAESIELSGVE